MASTKSEARQRRHRRVRKKTRGTAARPRLAVYRSNKHVYAQIIDDDAGTTLAAASSLDDSISESPATVAAAKAVGKLLGTRAAAAGITTVVFDRGGFHYHGRIASIADGAREAGLAL